jgi:hypothetical protein
LSIYHITGKDSCRTHGCARRESSRSTKRSGSAQICSSAGRIVAPRRDAVTCSSCIWQYRCHQVFNLLDDLFYLII